MVRDVGVRDRRIVLQPDFAAILATPVFRGVPRFRGDPSSDRRVERLPGRPDEEEGIHERVVDRALQSMALPEAVGRCFAVAPRDALLVERDAPRTVRTRRRRGHLVAVQIDRHGLPRVERAEAGRHGERDGGDVGRDDPDLVVAGRERGLDASGFPVLPESVHRHPGPLVVPERVDDEADVLGQRVAAPGDDGVDPAIQLGFGGGFVFVAGLGADEVREREAFGGHRFGHHVGGLLLAVDLAAVGDERDHPDVERLGGRIVEAPKLLLPRRRTERLVLEDFEEIRGLAEAGAGRRRRPTAGIVRGEVPARGAAEREAAHDQPVLVDRVVALHVGERFPQVRLAGEARAVAVAPVEVEHERAPRRELAGVAHAVVEEGEFGQVLAPAVEPEIKAVAPAVMGVETLGHDQSVRLH